MFDPEVDLDSLVPGAKDKLFKTDGDAFSNACVNFTRKDWSLYAMGYKDAADILVRKALETGRHQDFLVYPILFLYRHHLELMLKLLIKMACQLEDEPEPDLNRHKLEGLWTICIRLLMQVEPYDQPPEMNHLGRLLNEFAQVDPDSTAFRYPEDKNGRPSLEGMTHINIENVAEVVEKISSLLGGGEAMLGEYLSYKADMAAEYAESSY